MIHNPAKAKSALKGAPKARGKCEQTGAKLSIPLKAKSALRTQIHYPLKASSDLKKDNCF